MNTNIQTKLMKKKVVIVGGGFGGLNAAKSLNKAEVEITLIDKTNHHLFQPLLYQVATAALSPGDIAAPIRTVFRKQKNVSVLLGEVVTIDTKKQKVLLQKGELEYDYLILAPGTRHSYFGRDDWEKIAPGLKTLQDALNIRERMLLSFERAERFYDVMDIVPYLTFVIIGGGPTGVEMAGAIAEISKKTMLKDFRKINPAKTKIYLVEGGVRILSSYDEHLSQKALKDLEALGVTVLLEKRVTDIKSNCVILGEEEIATYNVIWAAGNSASGVLRSLNVSLDKVGRVIVEKDCSIHGSPNVFVIGDAANYETETGRILPGIAPVAVQQGRYVADVITKNILSANRSRFSYLDKGSMATIGRAKAIVEIGKLKLSGFVAWFFWSFVHILFLINFRNKYKVMSEWIYHFITMKHGIRLITHRPFTE